ncbi:CheR family methyltransferase [Loktanella sp. DJP18]|uniref:CheR family methyltransferase n=1 Tax=Loktanella sp. DJP18 TaxID=3409788 RepID=UPI003BB5B747
MTGHTIEMQDSRLARFRQLVHTQTGIKMPAAKRPMIESRLRRRLIELHLTTLDDYLRYIFDGGHLTAELPHIIDQMTTNKTDFFREDSHYRLLRQVMIPAALQQSAASFMFWSAAASTGAEAWSAAMELAEAARLDPRLEWRILGTDITERVIALARTAVYSTTELAPIPAPLRSAYVMAGKGPEGHLRGRIVPELRKHVSFHNLNLMVQPFRIAGNMDVVFLRNVLIYFEPDLQARVIAACADKIRPGGYFVVGHSESMVVQHPDLTPIAPGAYRKRK